MEEPLEPAGPEARAGAAQNITWEELAPKDWDPFKEFKDLDFRILDDGDPRAIKMLKRVREVWDNAPAKAELVGRPVRIPGFIVPLEGTKDGLEEFVRVPHFGACIRSPPPANQIVHALPKTPAEGLRSTHAVWIGGPLAVVKADSYLGAAGYRIEASAVQP
jgi:hypothetical protein